jgi:hypothetical protein
MKWFSRLRAWGILLAAAAALAVLAVTPAWRAELIPTLRVGSVSATQAPTLTALATAVAAAQDERAPHRQHAQVVADFARGDLHIITGEPCNGDG